MGVLCPLQKTCLARKEIWRTHKVVLEDERGFLSAGGRSSNLTPWRCRLFQATNVLGNFPCATSCTPYANPLRPFLIQGRLPVSVLAVNRCFIFRPVFGCLRPDISPADLCLPFFVSPITASTPARAGPGSDSFELTFRPGPLGMQVRREINRRNARSPWGTGITTAGHSGPFRRAACRS